MRLLRGGRAMKVVHFLGQEAAQSCALPRSHYAVLDRHSLADVVRNRKALAKILLFSKRPPAAAAERA
jgi:hypothetical protein